MSAEAFRSPRVPWIGAGQVEHLVADLTAIISADATLATVQAKLGENDQWLPVDGPSDLEIGKLINMNSSGPLRLGFGAWRDLLLGVQFYNGRGELVTGGGVPIKNVAGYDLNKIMVGQGEVFGKLVAVVTRAYRKPSKGILARFHPEGKLVPNLVTMAARPTWTLLNREELIASYLVDDADADFYLQEVKGLDARSVSTLSLAEEIAFRQSQWRVLGPWGDAPWVFRASVPPSRIHDFLGAAGVEQWIADPAFGIVLGGTDERLAPAIRGAALAMGGSAVFRSLPEGALMEITANESEKLLLEKIKRAFDPENKMAALPRA